MYIHLRNIAQVKQFVIPLQISFLFLNTVQRTSYFIWITKTIHPCPAATEFTKNRLVGYIDATISLITLIQIIPRFI